MAGEDDLGRAIEGFLFQLSANGRRPSSVRSYARELELLRCSLADRSLAGITIGFLRRRTTWKGRPPLTYTLIVCILETWQKEVPQPCINA